MSLRTDGVQLRYCHLVQYECTRQARVLIGCKWGSGEKSSQSDDRSPPFVMYR